MTIWTIILVGGMILLGAAIIYGRSKNAAHDDKRDIAHTEAAAHQAREETDRETYD